jgi:hypothetical protein
VPAAKPTDAERTLRELAIVDGNTRLNAFVSELPDALAPLLAKHGLELPDVELLHHRAVTADKPYCVLHFYVFAPPVESKS